MHWQVNLEIGGATALPPDRIGVSVASIMTASYFAVVLYIKSHLSAGFYIYHQKTLHVNTNDGF